MFVSGIIWNNDCFIRATSPDSGQNVLPRENKKALGLPAFLPIPQQKKRTGERLPHHHTPRLTGRTVSSIVREEATSGTCWSRAHSLKEKGRLPTMATLCLNPGTETERRKIWFSLSLSQGLMALPFPSFAVPGGGESLGISLFCKRRLPDPHYSTEKDFS